MLKRTLTAALLLAGTVTPLVTLVDAPTVSAVTCTVTVRLAPGANSAAVRCLEQRLRELSYTIGTPDTVYDTASVNAVKSFQRTRGLYPDGLVTSITGRQLGLRGALPAAGSAAVTVLGDSTAAAMRWYDEARNETAIYDILGTSYDLRWSVESCRRLAAASCIGRTDPGTGLRWRPVSVLPEMRGNLKGRLGSAVVIMAGYDDYPSITPAIDSIVAEAEAQGVTRVFWLTYRTTSSYGYGTYYRQHNAALAAAKVRHPNLVVLDWNTYTHRQSPATQDAWFESDQIHMTRSGGVALARYLKSAIDASAVRGCTAARATRGTIATATTPVAPDASPTGFFPVTTRRVFDSRPTKLGAGREVSIDLTAYGVPADAVSAAVNLTAIDPCRRGQLTASSCAGRVDVPTVSFEGGRTSGGMAIVPLTAGRLCVYASTPTDVVVELDGWFAPGGDLLHRVNPSRLVDTRGGTARISVPGPIAANGQVTVTVTVAGEAPVPSGATAAWLNVTAVSAGASSGVFVYPGACATAPSGATASVFAGRSASTAVLARIGDDGKVCVRAGGGGPVHAVIDVWGWFDAEVTDALVYRALPVTWLAMTTLTANVDKVLSASGSPVLVVGTASGTGTASLRTCGVSFTRPLLQEVTGERVSNLGVIAANASGQVCLVSSTATGAVVARTGEFVDAIT